MEWYWTLALLLGSILFLMFIGLPVGLAFILVNTVAAVVLFGRFGDLDINMLEGIHQLTDNAFANITISK